MIRVPNSKISKLRCPSKKAHLIEYGKNPGWVQKTTGPSLILEAFWWILLWMNPLPRGSLSTTISSTVKVTLSQTGRPMCRSLSLWPWKLTAGHSSNRRNHLHCAILMRTLLLRLILLIVLALMSLHPLSMMPRTTMEITMGVVLICSKAPEQALTSTLFVPYFSPWNYFLMIPSHAP